MAMLSEAEHYNSKFGLKDAVSFHPGNNGLTKAVLHCAPSNSTLEVYLHGAHITSWKRNQQEIIFMSDKAVYETGKALRGGIPLIFPQFGPGKIQNHGFARNVLWEVVETKLEKGEPVIVFKLKDSPATRKIWDYAFEATFAIQVGAKLHLAFRVKNTGSSSFDFQSALHTYFAVSDIRNTYVVGLKDKTYEDRTQHGKMETETRNMVTINEEVDRTYVDVEHTVFLVDKGKDRSLRLDRHEFPDVVVWNPWTEKAKAMADLGEEGYPKFVCVEVGVIQKPAHLEPNEEHTSSHSIYADTTSASL